MAKNKISAYAAMSARKKLEPFEYEPRPLGAWDVLIDVSHCGICHSDIHLIDDDWHFSAYPLVPGHEIVGTVAEVGEKGKHLKVGERVGVGWQAGSCMNCEWCSKGEENLCPESRAVCVGNYGGFGKKVIADSRFAFLIPGSLTSEAAAPLLCGGITVYSPLKKGAISGKKVGIVGVGGLGHLAIQFAKALGAEVYALSTTSEKERDAKKFGAHHFILNQPNQPSRLGKSLDFILSTVSADLDWPELMNLLRAKGELSIVGAAPNNISVPAFALIGGEKRISGSVIGSRKAIVEMLQFSAKYKIGSQSELMPVEQVNQAIEKVRQNKARYRMVLKH